MVYKFKTLEDLEYDGRIAEYDTFQVLSEHYNDMNIFYMDGDFYLITRSGKMKKVERRLLINRKFVTKNNNVRDYIEKYGEEKFANTTDDELIAIILGHSKEDLEK